MSEENQGAVVIELFPNGWHFADGEYQWLVKGRLVGRVYSVEGGWKWLIDFGPNRGWMGGIDQDRDTATQKVERVCKSLHESSRRRKKRKRDRARREDGASALGAPPVVPA